MMELKLLEEHQTFKAAAERARHLAVRQQVRTGLKRTPGGWAVLIPPTAVSIRPHDDPFDEDYPPFDDDPPVMSLRQCLAGCEDSAGRIYLGDGIYV